MQIFNTLLTVGTTIKDRYVVEDVLGKGEFGTSYLVRDRRENQKLFVLKDLIHPANKESSETRWLLFALDGTSFFCASPLARLVPTEPIKMDCLTLI